MDEDEEGNPVLTAVATRGYDNLRSGTIQETILTSDVVAAKGVSRVFSLPTPGDLRGCEAQVLYVPGVMMADDARHNVVYLASMANHIWAYDADNGDLLWQQRIANPIKGSKKIDGYLINDNWGILSTPVIDVEDGVLYCCSWSSPDGTTSHAIHRLHAISLSDGSAVKPPLSLEGATYAPGYNLRPRVYGSAARKQRASLLLTAKKNSDGDVRKTVFVSAGSISESLSSNMGWVIACDLTDWNISTAWASSGKGQGGGIWQAGAGIASDEKGDIYFMTGNGDFDAITDFGNCFVRLTYAPPSKTTKAQLKIVDWWAPWTDDGRVGLDDTGKDSGNPTPTNILQYKESIGKGWGDMDLGSGGPVLIPKRNAIIGAGKDGIAYLLNIDNMGKTQPNDLSPANAKANYAKTLHTVWFTYYPGPDKDSEPVEPADLNFFGLGKTRHQHGSPIVVDAPLDVHVFCWGENSTLRAWSLGGDNKLYYIGESLETASPTCGGVGGMPGAMMCVGANGNDGVLWACVPYGDANKRVTPGRLLAYDIRNYDPIPGSQYKRLRKIWDSQDWGITFSFNKFNPPVVINGKVYVATYNGTVDVYGLPN